MKDDTSESRIPRIHNKVWLVPLLLTVSGLGAYSMVNTGYGGAVALTVIAIGVAALAIVEWEGYRV